MYQLMSLSEWVVTIHYIHILILILDAMVEVVVVVLSDEWMMILTR